MRGASVVAMVSVLLGLTLLMPGGGRISDTPGAHAAATISGDINCDSAVTAVDAQAGLRALAGIAGANCFVTSGDVDCSGSASMADVLLLRRHIAGLSVQLPQGCTPIGSEINGGASSTDLIEAALVAGSITKGEALLYHLYSDLAPASLPGEFRGADEAHLESALFQEIGAAWNSLSSAEQDAIRPFLTPPASPGSWAAETGSGFQAQAVQWETVSSAKIKVWWQSQRPEDAARAVAILAAMESKIWPEVVGYMGAEHAPPSDAGLPNAGGDGKYDIYLVHNAPDKPGEKPILGWITPHTLANGSYMCEMTPTFMSLNSRVPLTPEFLSTLTHEFMHAVQFTYDVGSCNDYRWLMESTATWMESKVYPAVNHEHGYAHAFLNELNAPLEKWVHKDYRQYGSYLFWFYLEEKAGMPNAVRDVWAAATSPDSLAAIESVTSGAGGLKEVWPESALYNWNRPPFEDFTELDGVLAAAKWKDTDVVVTSAPVSYAVPTGLGHMQQDHLHYGSFDGVRSLTFINSFAGWDDEYAKVQALVKINGAWETEPRDWTDVERAHFCFDKPEEKVDELVIIISNATYFDRSHTFQVGPGELVASPLGCKGWTGSFSATIPYYDTTFEITVDNARFTPQADPGENPSDRYAYYDLVEISDATWTVSGTWMQEGCVASGTMTVPPPGAFGGAVGGITIDREENEYFIGALGGDPGATFTIACEFGSWQQPWPPLHMIWNGGAPDTPMKDEGGTFALDGEWVEDVPAYGGEWRWRFTEVP